MKRRKFININLATLGGVLIGRDFLYAEAMNEISPAACFAAPAIGYDLVINGAGLAGCFAAIEAAKRGLKVLVTDKRTSPGFDVAAKRKLWLNTDGYEKWTQELTDLFIPQGEESEIFNPALGAPFKSAIGDEILLFAGSLKKGLLRSLLVNKIDVLLMTDVCGIISDRQKRVSGVAVACKQGVYSIPCNSFTDTTDNNLFTRNLFNQKYRIDRADFVLELLNVKEPEKKIITVNTSYGLWNNTIKVHSGKKSSDQCFMAFGFGVDTNDASRIEQKARQIAGRLCKDLPLFDPGFASARLHYHALECSFHLTDYGMPAVPLKDYNYIENRPIDHSCASILDLIASVKQHDKLYHSYSGAPKEVCQVHYSGGKSTACPATKQEPVNECGYQLPLVPFPIDKLQLSAESCPLLIAGGGTAGSSAAVAAASKGIKPVLVDYFNDLGGSKTMGGVTGYYLGLNQHPHILQLEKDIRQTATDHNMQTNSTGRSFYHLDSLSRHNLTIINGAIICGAQTSDHTLSKVAICTNGELKWLEAPLTIDATGDGDIAYFAGEESDTGNSRMGITQNYSQWDLPFKSKEAPLQTVNKDYDIIDTTKIMELQRGLFLSHYEAFFYDFYPMLTVRESRRPEGLHRLNLIEVLDKTRFTDTIVNANSDFDPHHFGNSEYSRCAFLLPHSNRITVNIPYRSLVPKHIDGLLFSGRGICQTHNALQFTRMSADVILLGHATGQIAAGIIRQQVRARDFSVSALQKEWIESGFLTDDISIGNETMQEMTDKLSEGDTAYLFSCCRKAKQEILPCLIASYTKKESVLIAKALTWFGRQEGAEMVVDELNRLFDEEEQAGHPQRYFEQYESETLYWKINQDIALLGMANHSNCNRAIHRILARTGPGGGKVEANDLYNKNRIDLQLIPFYNRILNLCFYIERNPDDLFIAELERLSADPLVAGHQTTDCNSTRWRVYGSLLELSIASALARCGSVKGLNLLTNYLDDVHSDFRSFASRELSAVVGQNFGCNSTQWRKHINSAELIRKPCPLLKEIEI